MTGKTLLYNILEYDEIIRRILQVTTPLNGPTGYPVEIQYYAPNDCEPPKIGIVITEHGSNGSGDHSVFDRLIDQNATYQEFEDMLHGEDSLNRAVALCINASNNHTSYEVERKKAAEWKQSLEDENPF